MSVPDNLVPTAPPGRQWILVGDTAVEEPDYLKHLEWLMKNPDPCVLRHTYVKQWFVSTIFLRWAMLNYSKQPLLFETMIFWEGEGKPPTQDGMQWRYIGPTTALALEGHEKVVAWLKAGAKREDTPE